MGRSQLIVMLGLALGAATAAATAAASAPPAGADSAAYTVDVAVQSVAPHYRYQPGSAPAESCRLEPIAVHYPQHSRHAPLPQYRRVPERPRADGGAMLLGGLIGGLVGNRISDGGSRPVLTVAGAALGATIAGDLSRRQHGDRDPYGGPAYRDPYARPSYRNSYAGPAYRNHEPRYVRRCTRTPGSAPARVVDGYDVTYRYNGQTFSKWLPEHPGSTLPITVSVSPLR